MPADKGWARGRAGDRASCGGLKGYHVSAPTTWGVLPRTPVDGPAAGEARRAIAALAAALTTDASAASVCEQQLLLAQPGTQPEDHLAVAVWVPDPLSGEPSGVLVVDHLVGEDDGSASGAGVATPEDFEASLGLDVPEESILRRASERTRLPAGEAIVVNALVEASNGNLDESVTYVVFPDNCRDAISLTFATDELHLAAELAEDAQLIAESLTVTPRER